MNDELEQRIRDLEAERLRPTPRPKPSPAGLDAWRKAAAAHAAEKRRAKGRYRRRDPLAGKTLGVRKEPGKETNRGDDL